MARYATDPSRLDSGVCVPLPPRNQIRLTYLPRSLRRAWAGGLQFIWNDVLLRRDPAVVPVADTLRRFPEKRPPLPTGLWTNESLTF